VGARGLTGELATALLKTDEDLNRLVMINASHATKHAARIEAVWRRSMRLELLLDVACILLAAAATLVTVRTMRRLTGALEERARELDLFAARVAHDVLSPLSTIGLALPLIKERHCDDETTARFADRALASAKIVQRLVEGILAFARAGASADGEPSEVPKVIQSAIFELTSEAEQCHVKLSLERVDDCRVQCAPGVLTSILSNLVRNAIKYMGNSPTREVRLRVQARVRMVLFEVEDTGPGIARELQQYIFEPYARVLGSGQPGIGIGLATVKRFVTGNRGTVGVRSEPGKGSLFWFELPSASGSGPPPMLRAG
jgi:signal transduction histidine kinase